MRVGAAIWLLVLLAAPAFALPVFRAPFRAYESVLGGRAIALADFNGDGAQDVAVASYQVGTVVILLNNGTGEFRPGFQIAQEGAAVAAADISGDGIQDLLIVGRASLLSVHLGRGDGTFGPSATYATGAEPHGIAVRDMDGDGRADLVVANSDPFAGRSVSFFPGNGDGTFGARIDSPLEGVSPSSVALADFDEDGRLDLVAGYSGGGTAVYVMRGLGGGRFGPIEPLDSAYSPATVATGDLNGDGHQDFVAGGEMDSAVAVHLGRGDGTFLPRQRNVVPGAGFVTLADMDRDGHLDALTAAAVMRGRGDGTFGAPIPYATHGSAAMAVAGDIDGDSVPDVVTSYRLQGSIAVHVGHGDGTLGQPTDVATAKGPQALAAGDLNSDGHTDVASVSYDGPTTILLGDGNGSFSRAPDVPGAPANAMTLADLDRDGALDLLTLDLNALSARPGNGAGGFGPARTESVGPGAGSLATGDFNEDGLADVAVSRQGTHPDPRSGFRPDSIVTVLLGAGDGSFASRAEVRTGLAPFGVLVADVNRDGHDDLVVANIWSASVSVLPGNGDGTFRPRTDTPTGTPNALICTDLNGDGRLDVVTADKNARTLTILPGTGDGAFGPPKNVPGVGLVVSLVAGDWDGDGRLDLALTTEDANSVRLVMGQGALSFTNGDLYGTGRSPFAALVADPNEDGRPDIVTANAWGPSITPLLNTAPGANTDVGDPPGPRLALSSRFLQPNGVVTVTLTSSAPASIEVFDLAGRRMLRRALGPLGQGAHDVSLAETASWKSGLYFARLVQEAQVARARWIVVR